MSFQITLQSSGHRFEAAADDTILDAADKAGITLPYGCRNGACGSCKGRVIAGDIDHGISLGSVLPFEEREKGLALFCSALPLSDLVIDVRELDAVRDIPVRTLPCRVQSLERVAPDVIVMWLKLPT